MAMSTVESPERLEAQRELKKSGLEEVFKNRIRSRVQLVEDSAKGVRRFRNLWGLHPVRKQELFYWYDSPDFIFTALTPINVVAGKRFGIYSPYGALGELLVKQVINEVGGDSICATHEEKYMEGSIRTIDTFRIPGSGIEINRTAFRESRRYIVEEQTPTLAILWQVVRI